MSQLPESVARNLRFLSQTPSAPTRAGTRRCRCGKLVRITKSGKWGRHDAPYTGGSRCELSGREVE